MNRDQKLIEIAERVQKAHRKTKKMVAAKAYKLIQETVEDRHLQDELIYEFDAIAYKGAA